MTVDEIVEELKALCNKWNGHVEYTWSDNPEDWGFARGMEFGYEYAAEDLGDLLEKVDNG